MGGDRPRRAVSAAGAHRHGAASPHVHWEGGAHIALRASAARDQRPDPFRGGSTACSKPALIRPSRRWYAGLILVEMLQSGAGGGEFRIELS